MNRLLCERRRKQGDEVYKIRLKGLGGDINLQLRDVLYFESVRHDIHAVTTTSERFEFRGRLPQVEADLKEKGFVVADV